MSLFTRKINFLCSRQYLIHRMGSSWIKTSFYRLLSNEIFKSHNFHMQNKISIPVIANFCYNITKMKSFSINSSVKFEQIAEETLQNLCESFENVLEKSNLVEWDVNYSNGVLTVTLNHHGSYVLNKQSPNKQIWLSSPISGPKRYDYIDEKWIYKRDGISLCRILSEEMSNILQEETNFEDCL